MTLMLSTKLIVARDENGAIGSNNKLPWKLSADLKYFQKMTTGNIVIMGHNTYKSLPYVLPNRINIVITQHHEQTMTITMMFNNNLFVAPSLDDAILLANVIASTPSIQDSGMLCDNPTVFFIGGQRIYDDVMDYGYADEVHVTEVKTQLEEADTWFCHTFPRGDWKRLPGGSCDADDKNEYAYERVIYRRK
jgi:dihydrofolate reductase